MTWHSQPRDDPDHPINRFDSGSHLEHIDLNEEYAYPPSLRREAEEAQRQREENDRAQAEQQLIWDELCGALAIRVIGMLKEYGYWHKKDMKAIGYDPGPIGVQVTPDSVYFRGSLPYIEKYAEFQAEGEHDEICAKLGAWLEGWQEWWFETQGDIPDFWSGHVRFAKPAGRVDLCGGSDSSSSASNVEV